MKVCFREPGNWIAAYWWKQDYTHLKLDCASLTHYVSHDVSFKNWDSGFFLFKVCVREDIIINASENYLSSVLKCMLT